MFKKLVYFLFFVSILVQSQHTVTGTMKPIDADVSWVALYKLQGSKQNYVQNVTIENGVFKFELPENTSKGMYRLRYKMDNTSIVDFIYNNENVDLEFDPKKSAETLQFLTSEENILFSDFERKSAFFQQKLDSLQYSYFRLEVPEDRLASEKLYKNTLFKYDVFQQENEIKAADKLALHYMKVAKKYYSETLFTSPQEYLNSVKTHFFDFIDFTDTYLQHSTFISEHILNYVFYLNVSDDTEVQQLLYKNAVNDLMGKLNDNNTLKSDVLTTLLFSFSQEENVELVNYLLNNFYYKLPAINQKEKDIQGILKNIKLAIGQKSPNFTWEEKETTESLYGLDKASTYVLIFWSTSCSHCIVEVPDLYEYLKDKANIHVIDIALEKDEHGFNIYNEKFENWTNVLGLKKWENSIARDYEIVSTPTYFILDANKRIIAKPDHAAAVKAYFEK